MYYFFVGVRLNEESSQFDIGEVFRKNNDLRRKVSGSLAWIDIEHSSKLFPGDKVFTGSDSIAQLNLLDLAEIGMNSSTLLRIDPKETDYLELKAGKGYFSTKLSGKVKRATVQLGDTKVNLKGSEAEVQVNNLENKTIVHAMAGDVNFQNAESIQKLNHNQILGIDEFGKHDIVDLPAKLVSPVSGQEIVINASESISFNFKRLTKEKLFLEISKTPGFEEIILKTEALTDKPSIVIPAKYKGVIYWRIVEDKHNEYFQALDIKYNPLEAPIIYEPYSLQNYPIARDSDRIDFEIVWDKNPSYSYEGEIVSLGKNSQAPVKKFKTTNSKYLATSFTDGSYKLRIRGLNKQLYTDWSEWTQFSVGEVEFEKMGMLSPINEEVTPLNENKEVLFSWDGNKNQIRMQVASDAEFKEIKADITTVEHKTFWKPRMPGEYFWRIATNFRNAPIVKNAFKVEEPKLITQTPYDSYSYPFKEESENKIHFKWNDPRLSTDDKFIFEFASDKNFENIISSFELDAPEYFWNVKKRESIYWRVSTKYQKTDVKKLNIKYKQLLERPVLEQEIKLKKRSFFEPMKKNEIKYFSLYAQNSETMNLYDSSYVELFLPEDKNADYYSVEIFQDKEATAPLLKRVLRDPVLKWDNPPVGVFYWRLSYLNKKNQQGPWSNISKLIIEEKDLQNDTKNIEIISPKAGAWIHSISDRLIQFQWSESANCVSYQLNVLDRAKKNSVFKVSVTEKLVDNFFLPLGSYALIIECKNKEQKIVGRSQKISFSVSDEMSPEDKLKRSGPNPYNPSYYSLGLGLNSTSSDFTGKTTSSSDSLMMKKNIYLNIGYNLHYDFFLKGLISRENDVSGKTSLTITKLTAKGQRYFYSNAQSQLSLILGLSKQNFLYQNSIDGKTVSNAYDFIAAMYGVDYRFTDSFMKNHFNWAQDAHHRFSFENYISYSSVSSFGIDLSYNFDFKPFKQIQNSFLTDAFLELEASLERNSMKIDESRIVFLSKILAISIGKNF